MRIALVVAAALIALTQRPPLEARFIGNMALAISDGTVTLMSDFPYQPGYSRYMTYPSAEIRSSTAETLSLITHRHADHWDRGLFEQTTWRIAGPADVVSTVPASRVVPLAPGAAFGAMRIEAIETPHASIGHYSYVVTWHGRRLYFSGDTEDAGHLSRVPNLDVAFISPWLFQSARRRAQSIDARRIVIYHHAAGETVPECAAGCLVPRQGETIAIP
jgi:L-ascorbate metabolism protein UlaG (beta-lactamase superfamily)